MQNGICSAKNEDIINNNAFVEIGGDIGDYPVEIYQRQAGQTFAQDQIILRLSSSFDFAQD